MRTNSRAAESLAEVHKGANRSILYGASGVTLPHAHLQTAEQINNTYNFQGDTQVNVNDALKLLGNPKGCAWDPSRACLEGTRVIHIETILSWAASLQVEPTASGARILLVPGPAGSGKSALAHTICKELERRQLLVCSVFFDHAGQQPTAEDFTVVLIQGLCAISEPVKKAIAELIIKNKTLASASASRQIEGLVLPTIPHLPAGRNFVVGIDALDEQPNPAMLTLLRDYVPRLPSTFRFVLITRPDPRVMQYLENRPHIISFPHPLVGDKTQADIGILIITRLSFTDYRTTISPKLLNAFIAKSEGLFLWAETVLNHIDNTYNQAAELADIIKGASLYWTETETAAGKLDRLYEHILSKLEWKNPRFVEKYTILIGALVTLKEPLSRRGLAELYAPDGVTEGDVHRMCMLIRPLLQNYSKDDPTRPIRLLHLSVQEYLAERAPQPFRIDCEVHNSKLVKLCLLAIRRGLTPANVPFLGYSDGDWAWDVMESPPKIPVVGRTSLPELLWYSIQYFDKHWRSLREEVDEEHIMLVREIIVDNPRPLLEAIVSTRSMIDIRSFERKVLPCGPPSLSLARGRAKIHVSLARCLWSTTGRKAEALPLLQEAVGLYAPYKDEKPETTVELEVALSLAWLAQCKCRLGCPDDALPHVEEALTISRRLALSHVYEARMALADSLETKQQALIAMKQDNKACDTLVELVDLYRELSGGQPEKFQLRLAMALWNSARNLRDCKKHEKAIVANQEAISLLRESMDELGLAKVLQNHAVYVRDAGRADEAVEWRQKAVEIRRRLARENPEKFNADLAHSLHNMAFDLDVCGRTPEAILYSCEAIKIYRGLAAKDPSIFDPNLADTLHTHALCIGKAGRAAEAVECCQEVVEMHRQLVRGNPGKFNANLAHSLHNLAVNLDVCGRVPEAIPYSCEAIKIFRGLAAKDPPIFEPDLARSLRKHALYVGNAGRADEAVEFCQEAVEIQRRLARDNPEKSNPGLAQSLLRLALYLDVCGQSPEAIQCSCEAIEIHRRLAAQDPSTFEHDLAITLHNHALYVANAGRVDEAVEFCQEAVEIQRRLARDNPEKSNAGLAQSLHSLVSYLDGCGRTPEAIPYSCEAIEIYRGLTAKDSSIFEPALANSLHNHAAYVKTAGSADEAVEACQEAVEIRRRLARSSSNPERFNANLAQSLLRLAVYLNVCGRTPEAIQCSCEAIGIHRRLAAKDPSICEPYLAQSLHSHALYVGNAGRADEAVEFCQEAVEIQRRLARDNPEKFNAGLAQSLHSLAVYLNVSGRAPQAIPYSCKAIEIHPELAANHPSTLELYQANALHSHAPYVGKAGRPAEAVERCQEAVEIQRRLARSNPEGFNIGLAQSLFKLAIYLYVCRRAPEAIRYSCEAIEIRRGLAAKDPSIFGLDLAESLNNHAVYLGKAGKPAEAVDCAQEAVEILRLRFVRSNTEETNAGLAESLHTLAISFDVCGRASAAIPYSCEAIEIHRRMAAKDPSIFEPALANSLHSHAIYLETLGRLQEALECRRERDNIRSRFAAES
ncbi:TPR-like protein [Coprinopsis marcescibilis]|uniref:TPR-like protein n=1 Tax=Coprinopsis marcescibilis TaxID=230819 RepID=A0A5C3KX79_COPMA|nr:TPR-like protein [Coprinopsis marcescibilis]